MLFNTQVKDFMTLNPISVKRNTRIKEAREILEINNFRHLPVVDYSNSVIGIISDRDMRNTKVALGLLDFMDTDKFVNYPVSDIMTKTVFCVNPSTLLDEVAALMIEQKLSCTPVVEKNQLVGIISYIDLLDAFQTFNAYCRTCYSMKETKTDEYPTIETNVSKSF